MPLTQYQAELARLLSGNRSPDSFLAGGGAILLELLRRRGRVRKEDLERLDLAVEIDLHTVKREWLEALDSVEPFAASRSAGEVGCLYYSRSLQRFVDPRDVDDAVPHHGRPGGVLPRVVESDE